MEKAFEAWEQGLVRFIGSPGMAGPLPPCISAAWSGSTLIPFSCLTIASCTRNEDFDIVVRLCHERQVAVQTVKAIARGPWATADKTRTTWYQPLEEQADLDRAVHWVVGRPGIFLNTAGNIQLLSKILDAASRHERRPDDDAMTTMLEKQAVTTLFGLGPSNIR